jgi:Flp pilus assembly protein TadD
MEQSSPAVVRGRFQLFRGNGEGERLDRFLAEADPLSVSLPGTEARSPRRDWRIGVGVLLLGLASLAPLLWSGAREEPGPKVFPHRQKALLLISQGRQLMAEDRDGEALDDFSLAVRLAPDLAGAWIHLAACQLRNFQVTLAERGYQRALSLEPENPQALDGLGNLYLRRNEPRKAEQVWLRGGFDRQLARLCLLQGKFRQAEVHLSRMLHEGSEGELMDRMAQAARSRHLAPDLRSLLEPEPVSRSAWAELGWYQFKHKRYGEASAAFARALVAAPHDVNALSGMGSSLFALDRPGEARPYFERALALDGDHLRSLNGLASCLRSEGRTGEAIAVWRQTSARYPGVNDAIPGLAWTYFNLRDYRQAIPYFAVLAKEHPHDSRVLAALDVAAREARLGGS